MAFSGRGDVEQVETSYEDVGVLDTIMG